MSASKIETVYGRHSVRHVIENSPQDILELWVQSGKKPTAELRELLDKARNAGIAVQEVSRESLDKQTKRALHQGVMIKQLRSKARQYSVEDLIAEKKQNLFLLILDGVQDPHNLGACLRSANAAGVDAVIIPKDRSATLNSTVSKVACGAAENTPLIQVSNLARTMRSLQETGVWIVGTVADADAAASLYQVDLTGSVALVMGGEASGLRLNTRKHCDHLVSLPMQGVVESLNVSVATGICLYEGLRQRQSVE